MLDVARVEMQFGEQTGRVVLFLLVLGPVLAGGWYLRQRAATADIQRLQRLAGLPDPGSDRAALESRLLQRQSGRILGIAALLVVLGSVVSWLGTAMPWIALAVPIGAAFGAGFGQIHRMGSPSGPRVAQLRQRSLGDYVPAAERWLARAAGSTPGLGILAIGAAVISDAPVAPGALAGAGVLGLAIAASLLIRASVARVLAAPVEFGSPGGLAWAEVLRAQMVRDLLGSGALLATGSTVGVLWWLNQRAVAPTALGGVSLGIAILAASLLVALFLANLADSRFAWVRSHALADVPT